jgi:hypothetical protein
MIVAAASREKRLLADCYLQLQEDGAHIEKLAPDKYLYILPVHWIKLQQVVQCKN